MFPLPRANRNPQEYFGNLLNSFTNLIKSVGAGTKVFRLLDRQSLRRSGAGVTLPHVAGQIDFCDVSFTYPGHSAPVLRSLSFTVEPGQVVAIVGFSGAGKSTLFHLLENFYSPTGGSIRLDGVAIHQFDPQWLHRRVSLVGQEPVCQALGPRGMATPRAVVCGGVWRGWRRGRETVGGLQSRVPVRGQGGGGRRSRGAEGLGGGDEGGAA